MGSSRLRRWCAIVIFLHLCVGVAFAERPIIGLPVGSSSKKDTSNTAVKNPLQEPPKNGSPDLTDEQLAAATTEMKQFIDKAVANFDHPIKLIETKYFLFCSDLPPAEAKNWANLLDKMYARLATLFGVPKGKNIWKGKAIVFVFAKRTDYAHFEQKMYDGTPGSAIGLCHQNSDGMVVINFFRQDEELEFAHVLVHESVHGFIHRFRTPVHVPSWANEGLAEVIATELVPQVGRPDRVKNLAREEIELHGYTVGDFFEQTHISGWQYPVAETVCNLMIQQNKRGYVEFIVAVKDGVDAMEALRSKYKVPRERLVAGLGKYLNLLKIE